MSRRKGQTLPDEEVIARYLDSGNSAFFQQLYDRYFSKVYYQCLGYIHDEAIAEDLTQDIFLKLHGRLAQFQGKSRFSTWLFSIARNKCLDHLRKYGNQLGEEAFTTQAEEIEEVDDRALFQIRVDQLNLILNALPIADKELLMMKYAHDWQIDEIAETTGLTEGAIKMRLKRAKFKVIEAYKQQFQ